VLSVKILPIPRVAEEARISITEVVPRFWRAEARYGFMERVDIPALLAASKTRGCTVDLSDVAYYIGHATVVPRADGKGLPLWQEKLYAAMDRNSAHVSDSFNLPSEGVVEIGRQIAI
jgi:KUP system potassium uptake protein